MSDAKDYITKREIPQLFECLMTGLMYHRPSDHIAYLQECLENIKQKGVSSVRWDLFLESRQSKTPLPPVTPTKALSSRGSSRASVSMEDGKRKPVLPPIGAADSTPTAPPQLALPRDCSVVLLICSPGGGKRRLCQSLAANFGFGAVCAGDLLRREIDAGRCQEAKALLDEGECVQDQLLLPLVLRQIGDCASAGSDGVVVEGFPRSVEQLRAFVQHVGRVDLALLVDFDEQTAQDNLVRRSQSCVESRDRPGPAARRLSIFKSRTLPLCRQLDDEGKLLLVPAETATDEASAESAAKAKLEAALREARERRRRQREEEEEARLSCSPVQHIRDIDDGDFLAASGRIAVETLCPTVFVLGAAGSGRAELARRLAARYDNALLIRATEEAAVGGPVPDADWASRLDDASRSELQRPLNAELLVERLRRLKDERPAFVVVDGFPQDEAELRAAYSSLGRPDLCLLVDCTEQFMMRRLLEADSSQAALVAAKGQMQMYKQNTLPVVQHFDKTDRLCVVLGDREQDEVLEDLVSIVDYFLYDTELEPLQQQQWPAAVQAKNEVRPGGAGELSSITEEDAAARIQAGFRGFQTRKNLANRKEE